MWLWPQCWPEWPEPPTPFSSIFPKKQQKYTMHHVCDVMQDVWINKSFLNSIKAHAWTASVSDAFFTCRYTLLLIYAAVCAVSVQAGLSAASHGRNHDLKRSFTLDNTCVKARLMPSKNTLNKYIYFWGLDVFIYIQFENCKPNPSDGGHDRTGPERFASVEASFLIYWSVQGGGLIYLSLNGRS